MAPREKLKEGSEGIMEERSTEDPWHPPWGLWSEVENKSLAPQDRSRSPYVTLLPTVILSIPPAIIEPV